MPAKYIKMSYNAAYYQLNRDKLQAYQRAYHHRTKNTERILRVREYNKQYYAKNKANWNRRAPNRSIPERQNTGKSDTQDKPVSFVIDFR